MSLLPEHPSVTGPADPEHDPAASYALEPAAVKALTDRIVDEGRDLRQLMRANLRPLKKLGRA
jgi:succinate-semialdehyde dehydrogenase/glutarate-semialdehyde dehydrogenase